MLILTTKKFEFGNTCFLTSGTSSKDIFITFYEMFKHPINDTRTVKIKSFPSIT